MAHTFALAFLLSGNDILLLHRADVAFGSGLYGLSGGKVEQGETARQAVVREIREELGLEFLESDFQLVHTFHHKGIKTEYIALIFKADISKMIPINNEPNKHDDMQFFNPQQLPENIIPAHKQAIECIMHNVRYSEYGW